MTRYLLYFLTAFLTLATLVLGLSAYHNFWFWKVPFLDIIMHFLAGASVALLSLTVCFWWVIPYKSRRRASLRTALRIGLASAIFFGVIWELFEFSVDEFWSVQLTVKQLSILKFSISDTLSDILFDIVGGLVAGLIFWLLWINKKAVFKTEPTPAESSNLIETQNDDSKN